MSYNARDLRRFGRRLVVASIVVSAALLIGGRLLIGGLLPLFETVFASAQPGFEASIRLEPGPISTQIITARAHTTTAVPLDAGHVLEPYTDLNQVVWMDLLHALIPVVILLTALSAWPVTDFREILLRALFGIPAVVIAVCSTTPLYLAGRINVVLEQLGTAYGVKASPYPSPLMIWMVFTEMGGIWLLPILLAVVCVHLGRRMLSNEKAKGQDRLRVAIGPEKISQSETRPL